MGSLQDKVALITGAGSGIGQAIALRLSQGGAQVAIGYVGDSRGAEETKALLPIEARSRALCVQADIRQVHEVQAMVEQVISHWGRLDIVICNAALYKNMPFLEMGEEDWRAVVDTNLSGTFFCAQTAAKHMVKANSPGRIIIIGSTQGQRPIRGTAAYAATKGALRTLTKTMALELAEHQITINLISPGVVESAGNINWLADPEVRRSVMEAIPLSRIIQPSEVAELVAFIAADSGGAVTGSEFVIDGGLLAEGPQV